MRRRKMNIGKFAELNVRGLAAAIFLVAVSGFCAAQQAGQKTFPSAEAASQALVTAAQSNDEQALNEIFGREGRQIVSSGDDAEDAESRASFVKRYQEMHRLVNEPDGTTMLYIGAENWPTPIPLVKNGNAWYFDTAAGKQEILFRRIGRNELSTIRVCQELVAVEKEYKAQHGQYAAKIYSDEGQHDGLYWKVADGGPQSPIGPLVAAAVTEGPAAGREGPATPYRGYYFHILTRQGKGAPGGAKSFEVNGKMTEGFAVVAYPAEYKSSGVMTFIAGPDGVVYEKDLGKKTEMAAKAMKEFNPDSGWRKTQDESEDTQAEQKGK